MSYFCGFIATSVVIWAWQLYSTYTVILKAIIMINTLMRVHITQTMWNYDFRLYLFTCSKYFKYKVSGVSGISFLFALIFTLWWSVEHSISNLICDVFKYQQFHLVAVWNKFCVWNSVNMGSLLKFYYWGRKLRSGTPEFTVV